MAVWKNCQFPWLDSVVNTYAQNTSVIYSDTRLQNCCLSPGNCPNDYLGECTYGRLDCKVGNSKYVCEFSDYTPGASSRCFQEGSLAVTRNKPCCPPMLNKFLMQRTCLEGAGSVYDNWVCCPKGEGTCQFVMGCIGYQGFIGSLGEQHAVYTGYVSGLSSGSSYCVEEVAFSAEKTPNCYGVGSTKCNLGGGVAPPPVVTTTIATTTTSALATTKPTSGSGTGPGVVSPTNNRSDGNSLFAKGGGGGRSVVKKAALLLFVPLILQILFI